MELSSYSIASFRQHCGFYFRYQEIISGSILENITLGKAGMSVEAVMDLIKELKFQSIIQGNQNGLESILEPFGSRLSANMVRKFCC